MAKNYYHRSFIILKPEDAGYAMLPGREPAGYCKLEIRRGRGKIQIYVQDLKPAEELGGVYYVYLASEEGKVEPLKLTSMQVDGRGRGEVMAEFNAEDIMDSGYPLDAFHALAIVFKLGSPGKEMRIAYPLVGYSGKNIKIDWAGQVTHSLNGDIYQNLEHSEDSEGARDETADINDNKIIEAEEDETGSAHMVLAEPEVSKENDIPAENKEIEQNNKQEISDEADVKQREQADELEADESEAGEANEAESEVNQLEADESEESVKDNDQIIRQAYQETYQEFSDDIPPDLWQEDHQDELEGKAEITGQGRQDSEYGKTSKDEIKGNYWENVKGYFTGMFKTHRLICPFEEDMGDAEWIRVQQQPPAAYPGYYADPYYNQAYPPHHHMYLGGPYFDHYIVGLIRRQGRVRYVVYGIPSMYSMMPPVNMSGFSRWISVRNGYGMGYWLVYIDASTGCVVYPYGKE